MHRWDVPSSWPAFFVQMPLVVDWRAEQQNLPYPKVRNDALLVMIRRTIEKGASAVILLKLLFLCRFYFYIPFSMAV
jgi:hypothetical protein